MPVFYFLDYFLFLLNPWAFVMMGPEMKRQAVYKILNKYKGETEADVVFFELYQDVIRVQVFLYQR